MVPASAILGEDGFDGTHVTHEGTRYPGDIDWTPFFRDTDENGVDDLIDSSDQGSVDIFLKLESIPTGEEVRIIERFVPSIFYTAKYTNTMVLRDVDRSLIYSKLRYLDRVTFIEAIPDIIPFLDVSAEGIKARPGDLYHDVWEELGITGRGVNIAVLDGGSNDHETAADMAHVALDDLDDNPLTYDPKFVAGWDFEIMAGGEFIDPHGDPAIGHGTHVSGTALGTGGTGNDSANRGVAPGAQLIDVKTISDAGFGGLLIPAMEWCIDNADRDWLTSETDGIQIMSMSLGTQAESDGSDSMSQTANQCVDAGMIVVVAAGNNGNSGYITPPAAADKVITVGATDDKNTVTRGDDSVAGYSNKGPRNSDGDGDRYDELKPDLVAPGSNIMAPRADSGAAFVGMSGTSMATPHISGVVALMLEANPDLTPAEVKEILHESSEARGSVYDPELSDKYSTNFGYGIVDAYQAVLLAKGSCDIAITDVALVNSEAGKERYDEGDELRMTIGLEELEGNDVDSYTLFVKDSDSGAIHTTLTDSMGSGATVEHSVTIDLVSGGPWNFTISVESVQPGDSDLSNNQQMTSIVVNHLPHAVLDANVTESLTLNDIEFTGLDSSDKEGEIEEYRFDFGDGQETDWVRDGTVNHRYEDDGNYSVTLRVKDAEGAESGQYSDEIEITVSNRAPSADAGEDISAVEGEEIEFQGTGSDKDGTVVLYEWDFDGDGNYDWSDGDNGETTHIFEDPGQYTVVFRTTDDDDDQTTDSLIAEIVEEGKNLLPEARISDPGEGEVYFTDQEIVFDGSGSRDPDGEIQSYYWTSDISGELNPESSESGLVRFIEEGGDHIITLEVKDNEGASDQTSVRIFVDTPPEAVIDTPQDDHTYVMEEEEDEIQFDASSSSDEDDDELYYRWTSDMDGLLYEGSEAAFSASLSIGEHTITLEVSDPYITRSLAVRIDVSMEENENRAPTATIAEPSEEPVYDSENVILFNAEGSTDPDGDIIEYAWTSDIDGELYSGTSESFSMTLSQGIHTITLTVRDDGDSWSEPDSKYVKVNSGPTAIIHTITPSPAYDTDTIFFSGEGVDEGTIKEYVWESSILGELNAGRDNEFSYYGLSPGTHIISLKVKDNYGFWSPEVSEELIVEEYIPPEIENLHPDVKVRNPVNNEEVTGIAIISGTASDEDGDVKYVELSLDGVDWVTVQGTRFWSFEWDTRDISETQHVITVRSFDGEDYSSEVSLTVFVVSGEEDSSEDEFDILGVNGNAFAGILAMGLVVIGLVAVVAQRKRRMNDQFWIDFGSSEGHDDSDWNDENVHSDSVNARDDHTPIEPDGKPEGKGAEVDERT